MAAFDQALGLVEETMTDSGKTRAWSHLARASAALGEIKQGAALAGTAWSTLSSIDSQEEATIIQAHVAYSFLLVGQHERAFDALKIAVLQSRYSGRESVLEVLAEGVPILATIDHGNIVWQLYNAVYEIESWWTEM